jgi:membrane protease YdiL (CAAX protease family)
MVSVKNWDREAAKLLGLGILASMLLGWSLSGLAGSLLSSFKKPDIQLVQFIISTMSFQGVTMVMIWFFLKEQRVSWNDAFGFWKMPVWRSAMIGTIAAAFMLVGTIFLGWLADKLMRLAGMTPQARTAVEVVMNSSSVGRKVYYGLAAVVLVPPAEELLFRGLIYPSVKQSGHPLLAVWGTSLLFAAIHFNILAMIPLLFVALALTLLYEATDNLLVAIFAHSLFNLANFMIMTLQNGAS